MVKEFFENPMDTRLRMANDPHRPGYHFLPPRNWMNDPNGLIKWNGRYHLFYQFNPYGALWGSIHWGHASSKDLIHWKDHPIALLPEIGSGDENGCWSGCMILDRDIPTAVYTGFVDYNNTPMMLAYSKDNDLLDWEKSPHNPVITDKPKGVRETDFRDPYVWREDKIWKAVLGGRFLDGQCGVLLYESHNLAEWIYKGILYQNRLHDSITMWECPNFFALDGQYILLFSLSPNFQGVYYYVGDYDGLRFYPNKEGYLETGPIFYAPQVRQFDDERMILFAWLLEGRSDEENEQAGWAGVQSLPVTLELDDSKNLITRPVNEINLLRESNYVLHDVHLPANNFHEIPLRGRMIEIDAEFENIQGELGFQVLTTPDNMETTKFGYDFLRGEAYLDTIQSSLTKGCMRSRQTAKLLIDRGGTLKIRAFIDKSVIELFINDQVRISGRVYPTREDAELIKIYSHNQELILKTLNLWNFRGIWPDIKTFYK